LQAATPAFDFLFAFTELPDLFYVLLTVPYDVKTIKFASYSKQKQTHKAELK
jgi:hypothetical protein